MAEKMETPEAETPIVERPAAPGQGPLKKPIKKRKIGKYIGIAVAMVVVAAIIWGVSRLGKGSESEGEAMLDSVTRGSITSMVQGDGVTMPKNSASLTISSTGTVQEVYVSEGDFVTVGTPLYQLDSTEARDAVTEAQKTVDNCRKELNALYDAAEDLTIEAPFAGHLLDTADLQVDQDVSTGEKIATLVDDSKMRLSLYFSYTYENDIAAGQAAQISIPASMTQIDGTVEAVRKVRRISQEGSVLFEVDFIMKNPGTLTADMTATATLTAPGGETIYPYDSGELEYYKTTDIVAKTYGPVEQVNLTDYAGVTAGQLLVRLGAEDNDSAVATAENQLKSAQEALTTAQEDLDATAPTAPIDGTVLSVGITAGEEATSGTVAVSIADTSVMVVNAKIDDRNISYIKSGMLVDIDQWGTPFTGVVESVSLNGTYENGMSTFPAVITVDNPDGALMSGSSITYSFAASQSDDCLMVPIQSVKYVETDEGSISVVYVQRASPPENMPVVNTEIEGVPDGFYPVQVETGISDTTHVEITSGDLAEGETVFTQVMLDQTSSW